MKYGGLFIDYDGVCVNFDAGCVQAMGWSPNHPQYSHMSQSELSPHFKKHCDTVDFWANLPPMPDFQTLWSYVKSWKPSILTAYPQWSKTAPETATRGKMLWNKKHTMVPDSRFHCVARKDKAKYAMSGGVPNVLVDDHDKNCSEWEKAGGAAILHTSAVSTIIKLKALGFRHD